MNRILVSLLAIGFFATLAAPSLRADGNPEPKGSIQPAGHVQPVDLPALAKVSFEDALKAARAARTGSIIEAKLEVDDGALIYSVVIVAPDHSLAEVEIDAGNGRVLEIEKRSGAHGGEGDED